MLQLILRNLCAGRTGFSGCSQPQLQHNAVWQADLVWTASEHSESCWRFWCVGAPPKPLMVISLRYVSICLRNRSTENVQRAHHLSGVKTQLRLLIAHLRRRANVHLQGSCRRSAARLSRARVQLEVPVGGALGMGHQIHLACRSGACLVQAWADLCLLCQDMAR